MLQKKELSYCATEILVQSECCSLTLSTWWVLFDISLNKYFLALSMLDLSSLIRDETFATCHGSEKSKLRDHQETPQKYFLSLQLLSCILWWLDSLKDSLWTFIFKTHNGNLSEILCRISQLLKKQTLKRHIFETHVKIEFHETHFEKWRTSVRKLKNLGRKPTSAEMLQIWNINKTANVWQVAGLS